MNLKTKEHSQDGCEHRFFVYNPDITWRGAFFKLEQTHGSLPLLLAGIGHDLFTICQWMLAIRVALIEEHGDKGKGIKFHLLVPTLESLVIPSAFVFLEALFPLT